MCGALRVCWSWEWELLRVIDVELKLRTLRVRVGAWWYWCRARSRRRQTTVILASVRVVCVEFRSLYFSCDLLIVLLLFSLLPIYFYFEKRVGFRSLTTKQDSFPTGGIRTWQFFLKNNWLFNCNQVTKLSLFIMFYVCLLNLHVLLLGYFETFLVMNVLVHLWGIMSRWSDYNMVMLTFVLGALNYLC